LFWGGYHPTFTYETLLKNDFIDIVILGEGEYTMPEIAMAAHAKMIAFMDDTFTMNRKRVKEVCSEIRNRNLDLYWGCTARADTLSPKLLKKMKESGCITLFLGVESADQQHLDKLNKRITLHRIRRTFELTRELNLRTIASAVLGMPGDNRQSIEKTINFVKSLNPSYAVFSLATPYPGTDFYIEASKQNLIKVNDWSKYTLLNPILETVDCSLEELKSLQKQAFMDFYLRPGYIIRQTWRDGFILLKTVGTMIKDVAR